MVRLQEAIGAELLRCTLLGAPPLHVLGRYEVEGFLGRGASGLVVSARDLRLDRPVALKLSIIDDQDVDLSEARALAKVDHPNVVRVHDADMMLGTLQGQPWRLRVLVMQRTDGITLRSWLNVEERSTDEILEVFRGAGRGLAAAHDKHIVHRDFKPDNVLVRDDGVPQVLDFGFALAASSTRSASEGRRTLVAGTEVYMAPEALNGMASARADQYAFAISLSEALTGKIERPLFWRPGNVPRFVWRALRRATRSNPLRRYDSMAQLLERLERPRRWPPWAMLAVILMVGGAYGARGTHVDWASMLGAVTLDADAGQERAPDLAPSAPSPVLPDAALPLVPTPEALTSDAAAPDEPAPELLEVAPGLPEEVLPPPLATGCVPLSTPGERRVRATSVQSGMHGCYLIDLAVDPDGCASVTRIQKTGSSSDLHCWRGAVQEGVDVSSSRSAEGLVVTTTVGPRSYRFAMRSDRNGRLDGTFTSEISGRSGAAADVDHGTLEEVQ
ncbi:MAG: protein kinase [Deltaproteobacteria bacterium]|nr:protein kinase [Deltaproteobacteria bacterium]